MSSATWHIHMSGSSRDCDGTYSDGHDIPARMTDNETGQYEDDIALIDRALTLIWRFPEPGHEPITIELAVDELGRVTIYSRSTTDEGYWSGQYVICNRDDEDPSYSGYRDHTAERMGY